MIFVDFYDYENIYNVVGCANPGDDVMKKDSRSNILNWIRYGQKTSFKNYSIMTIAVINCIDVGVNPCYFTTIYTYLLTEVWVIEV